MTNGASNFCSINGLTGEEATIRQTYGVLFSNNAQTPVGWAINDTKLPSITAAISAGAAVTLDNFKIQNVTADATINIAIAGTLQNSPSFDLGNEIITTIGTSTRNRLTGDVGRLTVTTRTNDFWIDTGSTNKTWTPAFGTGWTNTGVTFSSATCCVYGNLCTVTATFGGTACAAAALATITGLPFTAAFRSALVSVVNGDTGAFLCNGAITSGTTLKLGQGFANVGSADVTISATYQIAS